MPSSNRASGDELLEALRSMRTDINDLQKDSVVSSDVVSTSVRDSRSNIAVSDASAVSSRGGSLAYRIAPRNWARTPDGLGGPDWSNNLSSTMTSSKVTLRDYETPHLWSIADWRYCFTLEAISVSRTTPPSIEYKLLQLPAFSRNTDVLVEIYFYMTLGSLTFRATDGSGSDPAPSTVLNTPTRYTSRSTIRSGMTWSLEFSWSLPIDQVGYLHLAGVRAEAGALLDRNRYFKLGASKL